MKSLFSKILYKTKNISQNLKHGLNVPKTPNTTKSTTWLKVSSNMIPKTSLYKIKNMLGDDSRYPTFSHKKMLCQTLTRVIATDFVGEILEVSILHIKYMDGTDVSYYLWGVALSPALHIF